MDHGWISQVISFGALILGGWWARKHTTPTEHARAQQLAQLAADTAALVVGLNPKAPWAYLLKDTVAQLAAAAGVPTRNREALERAAAGALARLGKTTDA